jgi:hypothetical protein
MSRLDVVGVSCPHNVEELKSAVQLAPDDARFVYAVAPNDAGRHDDTRVG